MEQLKMYWIKKEPVEELELPEGYSFSKYKSKSDKLAWVECCKNGLVGDDADEKSFDDAITKRRWRGLKMKEDVFFLDYNGEHIATITAYVDRKLRAADVHMVGIRTDFRGRGLAKYINNKALVHLYEKNIEYAQLTTDDWRKGAVKSYLNAGFLPVEYDEGMEERWTALLTELNVDSVQMLNEDRTPYKIISATL